MRLFDIGAREGEERVGDRILTIPNVLSFLRLAILPLVYVLLVGDRDRQMTAFWLLFVFSWSDWFDGYIARRFDQVSRLGKLLDPISDRVLFVVVGIALVVADVVPAWVVVATLARDVPVLVGGVVLLRRQIPPPAVTRIGKMATFLLMWAFPSFLLSTAQGGPGGDVHGAWRLFAWAMYGPGLVLYWISAAQYVRVTWPQLRRGQPTAPTPPGQD